MANRCVPDLVALLMGAALPLISVHLLSSGPGFGLWITALLILLPITALGLGVYAGTAPKTRWASAALFLALFVLSGWKVIEMGWEDTLVYGAVYLGIALAGGVASGLVSRARRRQKG